MTRATGLLSWPTVSLAYVQNNGRALNLPGQGRTLTCSVDCLEGDSLMHMQGELRKRSAHFAWKVAQRFCITATVTYSVQL
jgi:hypothetical protein